VSQHFLDYYRCPENYANFKTSGPLSGEPGFFRWGQDTLCYARTVSGVGVSQADHVTHDLLEDIERSGGSLPFDADELLENLQRERYTAHFRNPGKLSHALVRKIYYLIRPLLAVPVRKHLQRISLRNWDKIPFPQWPVDCTVDRIHRKLMADAMRAQGVEKVPFIWFWPDNYETSIIITHDVEDPPGKDFCGRLMDVDESFGFRSSFQVVPEVRYPVSKQYLESITSRGFEVNVHDLTHDGRLYAKYDEFLRRAKRINQYGHDFGAVGFRSGILYRNADWYGAFEFLYDMSIPNVAHLDPQRGGCCTVKPYFIGNIVELPVTCTQDYTLFHILQDYSIDLWKTQVARIVAQNGLVSILVHPDYIIEPRAQGVYKSLLAHLAELRDAGRAWAPLPREAAEWWHMRRKMQLVFNNGEWHIEGEGKERATIAYACVSGDEVAYIHPSSKTNLVAS